MSDVTSGVGFWPFWLRLPGRAPNRKTEIFQKQLKKMWYML